MTRRRKTGRRVKRSSPPEFRNTDRWRRLRAATCSVSGLDELELDVQADRVYLATTRGPEPAHDLGGFRAPAGSKEDRR